jgi:hypothetical protein
MHACSACVCICTRAGFRACSRVDVRVRTCVVLARACTCAFARAFARVHAHMRVHAYVCVCVCMPNCVQTCVCVCLLIVLHVRRLKFNCGHTNTETEKNHLYIRIYTVRIYTAYVYLYGSGQP